MPYSAWRIAPHALNFAFRVADRGAAPFARFSADAFHCLAEEEYHETDSCDTHLFAATANAAVDAAPGSPMRVGIVGLVHGHVGGFLKGGALTPAGGILNRPDVQMVGIVEPDRKLFDSYAQRYRLSANLHFRSIQEMVSQAHPRAVRVFTALRTAGRAEAERCWKSCTLPKFRNCLKLRIPALPSGAHQKRQPHFHWESAYHS